ncbi:MAG: thioredoxin family protein [Crocinitomicaceae bacterium]|nr:thioredoxin family protein [Crocinitomicaceae bacterium]
MKTNSLLTFLFICFGTLVFGQGMQFETSSFEEIKAKAKKENKLIFLDAYTTWCGPCKWMAKTVFTNDTVAQYYNANFINAKIDMEKGEGIELAKKYAVRCYPNLLFINGDGEVVHRKGGSLKPADFITLGEKTKKNEKTYTAYQQSYEANKDNATFLVEYLTYLSGTCLPLDNVVDDYFKTQTENTYTSRGNWTMIKHYVKTHTSEPYKYLTSHLDNFYALYTKDSVDAKINDILLSSGKRMIYSKTLNEEQFTNFKKEIASMSIPSKDYVLFHLNVEYYSKKEDWKNYTTELLSRGDTYLKPQEYNSVAWNVYQKVADEAALNKVAGWMEKLFSSKTEKDELYAEYDTYACVLFKLKRKNDALKAANEAIKQAKKMGLPENEYEETTELIKKINTL